MTDYQNDPIYNVPPPAGAIPGFPTFVITEKQAEQNVADQKQAEIDAKTAEDAAKVATSKARNLKKQEWVGFRNPPFDRRIRNRFEPGGTATKQGIIQQPVELAEAAGTRPYECLFLYNPSTITWGYAVNNTAFSPEVLSAEANAGTALIPNQQVMSFDLLFDRTYEMGSPIDRSTPSIATPSGADDWHYAAHYQGVYADIAALERVVGIFDGTGPITGRPLLIYFALREGSSTSKSPWLSQNRILSKPLSFYGRMSSMSVEYTLFNIDMVPVRASVAVSFTQLGKSSDKTLAPFGFIDPRTVDAGNSGTGSAEETQ